MMGKRTKRAERKSKPSTFSSELPISTLNFFLFIGNERRKGRLGAVEVFHQNPRSDAGCFPFTLPHFRPGAMDYRYISEVMDGARRLLRMPPDSVRKTEYRREASAPGTDGRPRWEFPTVWLMGIHTVYSQSIALPTVQGAIPKETWNGVLHSPAKPRREAGEQPWGHL